MLGEGVATPPHHPCRLLKLVAVCSQGVEMGPDGDTALLHELVTQDVTAQ